MNPDLLGPLMFVVAFVLIFTGYPVAFSLGGTALLLAVCWLLEPWRRLTQVASACGKGMREEGLRGIGAVGCMEPLIIIAVLSLGAGVFALRLWLETGP